MSARILCCIAAFAIATFATDVQAAKVSFLGVVLQGRAGPVLNSLPRNFTLVLDYTPTPGGSAPTTGTLAFPATPNGNVANPDVNPSVQVATQGGLVVGDNTGPGGTDFFSFNGNVAAGLLGPNQVNYSFTFVMPNDTIDDNILDEDTIAKLLVGDTQIAFAGGTGGFSGSGLITGAPEPGTMLALTGLVMTGCGIGYRRRLKKTKSEKSDSSDE